MTHKEFKIGEVIPDTDAFGTVTVKDIFISSTNPIFYCYRVEDENNVSHLTSEENLMESEEA